MHREKDGWHKIHPLTKYLSCISIITNVVQYLTSEEMAYFANAVKCFSFFKFHLQSVKGSLCNFYTQACTHPTAEHDGASSYRLTEKKTFAVHLKEDVVRAIHRDSNQG